MKLQAWMGVLTALVAGALGGALVQGLMPVHQERLHGRAEQGQGLQKEVPVNDQELDGDEALSRIRRLEHRVALLTSALQSRHASAVEEAVGERLDSPARDETTDVADPVFEAAVLDIMDRERERKEEERETWRRELHVERGRRYASELTEALRLSSLQQSQIADVVAEYFDEWRALRDEGSPRRPTTRSQWLAERERIEGQTEERLRKVLDSEQYAAYDALSEDEKLGWGRGARRSERRASDENGPSNSNSGQADSEQPANK